uniref:Claudin n=2 Tax=Cercopithecidae TaxID=9527 RepID=A0A2K5P4J7_CERAT
MVATCLQVVGFVTSFVGWIGVIVTTSTNDWVVTCGYTIPTCRKLDELGSKGLWADCVMATGLYHCKPLVDILILPGYVQACRALMIAASVLGLPAILLLLTVLPCIRMGHEPGVAKYRRAQLAGVLLILLGCQILWARTESSLHSQHLVQFKQKYLEDFSCLQGD